MTTTYYEQPVLKPPVWKAYIPTYFWVGGIAGGCMVIGAVAQLAGERSLVKPARVIASVGTMASAALLIADLGRPARFLNMMRVVRLTSPMNVGTWILSGAGATATGSLVFPRLGIVAGAFGLGLASYTAVLLANTAVPAWQYAAKQLPPLFTASAAASAASALDLVPATHRSRRALQILGVGGKVAELVAAKVYERALEKRGVARPRNWMTASKMMTASSVVASLLGLRRISGVLGLGGALALRFAVMDAGRASTLDPRATFEPQRRALNGGTKRALTAAGSAW